ncbi:MAG: ParB/RepB/Spo0J family partition protein [Anaerolineae bacterium]|nr:ParB/RepB/Spo0J family partition protein [Gloeobacterales cyanobacterium ES-bin-313]
MPNYEPIAKLKGVSALLDDSEETMSMVLIGLIVPWDKQPRRKINPEPFKSLVESVRVNGILQPLLVRPIDNKYLLVAGERRWRAALEVGLREVPVYIREMGDEEATECALLENLQREDLNAMDETEGVLDLLSLRLSTERDVVISLLNQMSNMKEGKVTNGVIRNQAAEESIKQLFERFGKLTWQSFLKNRIPLLNLPSELSAALREGKIDYTKARTLAKIKNETMRSQVLNEVLATNMTCRDIERHIRSLSDPQSPQQFTVRERFRAVTKRIEKASVWDDPSTQEELKSLLEKMEALLAVQKG